MINKIQQKNRLYHQHGTVIKINTANSKTPSHHFNLNLITRELEYWRLMISTRKKILNKYFYNLFFDNINININIIDNVETRIKLPMSQLILLGRKMLSTAIKV